MALFTYFSLFGVADGKAMILLSLAVPITPFADWIFPSLALSSLVDGVVFALIVDSQILVITKHMSIFQEKTRDAGFTAFFTLAFRPREADQAQRRNAAE